MTMSTSLTLLAALTLAAALPASATANPYPSVREAWIKAVECFNT